MFPKIVQVVPTEEYTVYVYFEDGKIVCYDLKPLLAKEAFAVLRENTKCIDIDPDTLYMLNAVKEKIA